MSLILEALKKSEARRQLGEAPGIGTPFTVIKRRRNPLPLIATLIVIAAGFGWYYLHTMPTATAPTTAASPTLRGIVPGPHSGPASAPAAPVRRSPTRAERGPQGAGAAHEPTPTGPRIPIAGLDRTNAESPVPSAAVKMHDAQPRLSARPPQAVNPAAAPAGQKSTAVPAASKPLPVPAGTPAAAAAATRKPHAQAPQAAKPASEEAATPLPGVGSSKAPNLPFYYELPYNVRKDLPDITISVHVYSKVPAQRFVIIDGERKVEGDTVHDGLTLREIRPDGIVLEFQGHKFFYPRQGR